MEARNLYSVIEVTLAAGGSLQIARPGNYVRCLANTGAFEIAIDSNPRQKLAAGLGFSLPTENEFNAVWVFDTSGAPNTVELGIGTGTMQDSRLTLTGNGLAVKTWAGLLSTADVSIAAATTDQVLAANTSRHEAIIMNLAANTQTMRVGDANAGAARGLELAPGQALTLETKAAIHAYNPGASAESLAVLETEES